MEKSTKHVKPYWIQNNPEKNAFRLTDRDLPKYDPASLFEQNTPHFLFFQRRSTIRKENKPSWLMPFTAENLKRATGLMRLMACSKTLSALFAWRHEEGATFHFDTSQHEQVITLSCVTT